MDGDDVGSREGAKARSRIKEPDRDVFIRAYGAKVVEMMESILTLPPEIAAGAESLVEVTAVDGHSWIIRVEYEGFGTPQDLRAFAPSREIPSNVSTSLDTNGGAA